MTQPVSINTAEALIEAHLRKWLKEYLGECLAREHQAGAITGMTEAQARNLAPKLMPQDWGRTDEWMNGAFLLDPLPALYIVSGGRLGNPTYEDGLRIEPLDVAIVVAMPGDGQGDRPISAGRGVRLYDTALLNLAEQKPHVSDAVKIEDAEASDYSAIGDETRSTLGVAMAEWTVKVATASTSPDFLTDPPDPSDWPRPGDEPTPIETTIVTVEAA